MIVDGTGLVAGRAATRIAKALIKNESVIVVNSENFLLVGTKEASMEKYIKRVNASVKSNPHYGPKFDRIPSKMFKFMVKGMLPNRKKTALRVLKNLKVYNKNLSNLKGDVIEKSKCNDKHDSTTLKEIAESLGGRW